MPADGPVFVPVVVFGMALSDLRRSRVDAAHRTRGSVLADISRSGAPDGSDVQRFVNAVLGGGLGWPRFGDTMRSSIPRSPSRALDDERGFFLSVPSLFVFRPCSSPSAPNDGRMSPE